MTSPFAASRQSYAPQSQPASTSAHHHHHHHHHHHPSAQSQAQPTSRQASVQSLSYPNSSAFQHSGQPTASPLPHASQPPQHQASGSSTAPTSSSYVHSSALAYHTTSGPHHHHLTPVPTPAQGMTASLAQTMHQPAQQPSMVQPQPITGQGQIRRDRIPANGQVMGNDYEAARWPPRSQKQIEVESLPSNDLAAHYVDYHKSPSDPSSDSLPPALPRPTRNVPAGNRGTKLQADAVLQRRGRMYAWSPMVVENLYGNPYGYGDELKRKERAEEARLKKRLKTALSATLPIAALEAGQPFKRNQTDRRRDDEASSSLTSRRKRSNAPPHLQSPSPPGSPSNVVQTLARIGTGPEADLNRQDLVVEANYLDLATSPAIKYTLGVANKERALMRTVDDLVDGENGLLGVLSRLQSAMERAGRTVPRHVTNTGDEFLQDQEYQTDTGSAAANDDRLDDDQMKGMETDGVEPADVTATDEAPMSEVARVSGTDTSVKTETNNNADDKFKTEGSSQMNSAKPALDSSFLFGTGEPFFVPPGSMVTYEPVDSQAADPDVVNVYPNVDLNPLHCLFVTPTGLTTTIGPSPHDPRLHLPLSHPGYPHTTCVRLTPETQKQSVLCAIEKIRELTTDCQEYVHRLEEIRERLANVGRARRKVWQIVRERAIIGCDGEVGDGEADLETMRLRAEAEHAISGGQIETRRRRGVATAVASAVVS